MKKLIAFLKNLFCGKNTEENTTPDTNVSEDNVVLVDDIDTVIETNDECNCECENCKDCCNDDNIDDAEESEIEEGFIVDDTCLDEAIEEECENCEECVVEVTSESVDKLIKELSLWGINKENLNYEAVKSMIDFTEVYESYDDIIAKLAEVLGKTKGVISNSLQSLANKADFSKSEYDLIKSLANADVLPAKDKIVIICSWIYSL